MARQTFENLRDETMRRMGKLDPTSALEGRYEAVMTSAYYTLALTYHHYELHTDVFDTVASGLQPPELVIPPETYVVMNVSINQPPPPGGGVQAPFLFDPVTHEHLYAVKPVNLTGDPTSYARTRSEAGADILLFNRIPQRELTINYTYYRRPDEPVYSGAPTSEMDDLWDEYIIQKTLSLFWPAGFRFDFAGVAQETLAEFLQRQIQPPLVSPVRDVPERTLASESVGGQQ